MRVPCRFGAMRDLTRDPDSAVRRHYPYIIFRTANNRTIQGNDQLPLTVRMNRYFCCVIDEIKMARHGRAGCGVRVKQRIRKLWHHTIGNI